MSSAPHKEQGELGPRKFETVSFRNKVSKRELFVPLPPNNLVPIPPPLPGLIVQIWLIQLQALLGKT